MNDMGKMRSVNTHFWQDDYTSELPPLRKLLFLYLITSPFSNIAGVYEISRRQIIFDTGLSSEQVSEGLLKFEEDEKIIYSEGFVIMINHMKNNKLNPSMERARQVILRNLPENIRNLYLKHILDSDTLMTPCTQGGDRVVTASPSYSNSISKEEREESEKREKLEILKKRASGLLEELRRFEKEGKYPPNMLEAFFAYWTEPNKSLSKMRYELEKTWETSRRLATWASRDRNFQGRTQKNGRIYIEKRNS